MRTIALPVLCTGELKMEQVQSAKYLAIITIIDNLDWGQHISEIACKATNTMTFIQRNLALAPRITKEVANKTLVRPQLEYAALFGIPTMKLRLHMWRRCRGQLPGGELICLLLFTCNVWFLLKRLPLPLCAWDELRYFIVALPEPSI